MNGERTPLTVEIANGELRIRIGIDTLAWAVEAAPEPPLTVYDEVTGEYLSVKVVDRRVFACEVVTELLREAEDGTNAVHLLLDKAAAQVLENGSEGAYLPEEKQDA